MSANKNNTLKNRRESDILKKKKTETFKGVSQEIEQDGQICSLFALFVLEHELWGKSEVWLRATHIVCF